jgi:hypothetical protein
MSSQCLFSNEAVSVTARAREAALQAKITETEAAIAKNAEKAIMRRKIQISRDSKTRSWKAIHLALSSATMP